MSVKNIMIIDDDEELCIELMQLLVDKGFKVETAQSAEAGICILGKKPFDLLLLDLKMPGISGYEFIEFVKKQYPQLKVFIITGSTFSWEFINRYDKHFKEFNEEESLKSARLKLADLVLNKPFDIENLINKIKEI